MNHHSKPFSQMASRWKRCRTKKDGEGEGDGTNRKKRRIDHDEERTKLEDAIRMLVTRLDQSEKTITQLVARINNLERLVVSKNLERSSYIS
jgi:hypothetical protein